ncbi:MAG: D-alanyl-D-alanine carboxypeptidase family protein [Acidimicrobiia bacterium]
MIGLGQVPQAAGDGGEDPRSERERVRRERAEVAAQLDVLRAQDAEVERALADIEASLAAEESQLADAQRAVTAAEQQLGGARAAEAAILTEIADLEADMRDFAINAYIGGGQTDRSLTLANGNDLNEVAQRSALIGFVAGDAADLQSQLRTAREDLELARQQAEDAAQAAEARRAEVEARVGQVQAARDRQATFATDLDARIEARLAEAAALETLDQGLAAQIQAQEADLARRVPGGSRGGGTASPPPGDVPLRNVRGIYVHESIADELEALLAAAEGDGFVFGGGGYRDPAQQQRLREQNCPDPQSSPPSACSPPTARPGQSMHERGLAIDFTYNGRVISSRSSPAFRWLESNAGRFGFQNLPSEPWHWSTNGN